MTDTYNENTILEYVEGELSPEDQHAFKLAILKDAKLRKLVEQLVADRAALRRMPLEPVPVALAEQVDQYLERNMLLGPAPAGVSTRAQAERRFQLFRTGALTAIAAVLVLGVGLFVWQTWTEMRQFTEIGIVAMQDPAASPEVDVAPPPTDTSAEPILDHALAMASETAASVPEARVAEASKAAAPALAAALERQVADVAYVPEEPVADDWLDRQILPEIDEALSAVRRDYKSPLQSLAATPLDLPDTSMTPPGVAKGPPEPLFADGFEETDRLVQVDRIPDVPAPFQMDVVQMGQGEADDDVQEPAWADRGPVSAKGKGAVGDMTMTFRSSKARPKADIAVPLRAGEQPTEVRLTIVTPDARRSRIALRDWARRHRAAIRVGPRPPRGKLARRIDRSAASAARQASEPAIGRTRQPPTPQALPEPVAQLTIHIKAGQLRNLVTEAKRHGAYRARLALVPVLMAPKATLPTTGDAETDKLKDAPSSMSEQREPRVREHITLVSPIGLVRTDSKPMKVIVTIVPK